MRLTERNCRLVSTGSQRGAALPQRPCTCKRELLESVDYWCASFASTHASRERLVHSIEFEP